MPFKIMLQAAESGTARTITGVLENVLLELPDAVSQFIEGPGRWRIDAYFQAMPDTATIAAQIAEALGHEVTLEVVEVPDLDWVSISQAALPPVAAGRFTVHGSHDRARIPRGPNAILIDAGEAFGTAHHATTQGCLITLDRIGHTRNPRRILDLGCGSGVLAIAAARLFPAARIIASDNDPKAVAVAAENAKANGAAAQIAFVCAEGLAHPWLRHAAPFDLVAANILAGPLCRLAPSIARSLTSGGDVVLGGLLDPEAPEVIAAYAAQGFTLAERRSIAGWTTLRLARRSGRRVAEAARHTSRRTY
jgi:ribosomal protein L11 methyltransferase